MPKRLIDVREGPSFLDIVSHGRGGDGRPIQLSRTQIEQIEGTVHRVPEAVVKVLLKDSNNLRSVQKHIDYIGRRGNLKLETDDGRGVQGKHAGRELLDDWDLDLETHGRQSEFAATRGRAAPKLVHKLMFSMPPGTSPQGVLAAVRNFAREEFALKHRYAMVLHTDEPHPHVHVVVKAISEQGARLSIRKATLRGWRREFARHLREQGIAANATERAIRGEARKATRDAIYRASLRGDSTYLRARVESVAAELLKGDFRAEAGSKTLVETRRKVVRGWSAVARQLKGDGNHVLANDIATFVREMRPIRTDRQQLAYELLGRARSRQIRDQDPVR